MRIVVFSKDNELINQLKECSLINVNDLVIYQDRNEPLEIVALVCSLQPMVLIIDDDLLAPNSGQIMQSILQIQNEIKAIFITSDNSVELGRQISQLGVHYYGQKPLEGSELKESIKPLMINN